MSKQSLTQISTNYFNLIDQVGATGRYQYIIAFIFGFQWFILGALELSPSILFITSEPDCSNLDLQNKSCIQYVCSLDKKYWNNYYQNHWDSLGYIFQNIFICGNQFILTILISMIYLGCFFSNFIFSYFTDNLGRKYSLRLTWVCLIIGLIIIVVSWNIYVLSLGLFVTGLGVQQTQSISLTIFYQEVQHNLSQKFCMFVQMTFCLGGLSIAGIFHLIPHWQKVLILFFLLPTVINFFLMLYYVQQTPKFILKRYGVEQTFASLKRIAKINRMGTLLTRQDVQKYQDMYLLQEKKRIKVRIWQLFKFKSLRVKTISICIVFYCIVANYFGPLLIIDQINSDIFLTQAFLSLSQFVTYFITFICVQKMQRKSLCVASFFICLIINSYLITFSESKNADDIYLKIGLMCLIRFFISMTFSIFFLYCNQLYPSTTRGVGCGLYFSFGRISNFASIMIISTLKDQNSYFYFIGSSLIGIICVLFLPETLGQKLSEQIEQLDFDKNTIHENERKTRSRRKLTM